ncbi:hypothetical protein HZH66_014330 [Vespula vulgaris]|uniref:Uncharacterized protein n=1 Tax=Vespula vulgaris TaxID=7454 RepID=A0A834J5T1_VESVU|nr:hypothetical protein HZH66_014330 [Vespula vulgaris]
MRKDEPDFTKATTLRYHDFDVGDGSRKADVLDVARACLYDRVYEGTTTKGSLELSTQWFPNLQPSGVGLSQLPETRSNLRTSAAFVFIHSILRRVSSSGGPRPK